MPFEVIALCHDPSYEVEYHWPEIPIEFLRTADTPNHDFPNHIIHLVANDSRISGVTVDGTGYWFEWDTPYASAPWRFLDIGCPTEVVRLTILSDGFPNIEGSINLRSGEFIHLFLDDESGPIVGQSSEKQIYVKVVDESS